MLVELIAAMKEAREKRDWHRFDELDFELYNLKESIRKRYLHNYLKTIK